MDFLSRINFSQTGIQTWARGDNFPACILPPLSYVCPPPLIIVIITAIIQLLTYSCYLLFILIIYTFSLIPVENVCGFAERVFGQGQPGVLHNIVPSKVTR